MPIDVSVITDDQLKKIYSKRETHFCDLKSKEIQPRKLTKTLTAFANADGGELYIGIDEREEGAFVWNGFTSLEDANGHLQALEESCPLGTHVRYSFLRCDGQPGAVLFCEIEKTPDIRIASDGKVYLRRGAQNLPQDTDEKLQRLKFSKGIMSFEDQILNTDPTTISNSIATIEFSFEVIPTAEPDFWLRKQKLIVSEKPTVAGVINQADGKSVHRRCN